MRGESASTRQNPGPTTQRLFQFAYPPAGDDGGLARLRQEGPASHGRLGPAPPRRRAPGRSPPAPPGPPAPAPPPRTPPPPPRRRPPPPAPPPRARARRVVGPSRRAPRPPPATEP